MRGGEPIPFPPGVFIVRVMPDSPASHADLKPDDRIVALDGVSTKLDDEGRFIARISDFQPGDEISLLIDRADKEFTIKLKLGRRPSPSTP
jgi:serine protease Do